MNKTNRFTKPELFAFLLLILGHSVAAYTSYGYHHPDEHYQILEWSHYFLGLAHDSSHLAWEFGAQIRPWFQPLVHALLIKPFVAMGFYNPFDTAFLLRLVYGFLNLFSIVALWNYFKDRYSLNRMWAVWISLLWFFPYMHVRTSSENLAGIFLSFALLAILKNQRFFLSGILFGFAFLARYQVALGLFGLGLALLIKERKFLRAHLNMIVGFLLPVALGVLMDRIGYGNWVFTAYRYFKVNLVDGVAASYNPYPWYQYFIWIVQLNPLVSLPLFFGSIRFMQKGERDDRWVIGSFVWSFFILHCFLTNKEYRFLFPILNLVPFMAMVTFAKFEKQLAKPTYLIPYAAISAFAFMVSTLHGASVQTLGAVYLAQRNLSVERLTLSNRDYPIQSPFYHFPPHPFHQVQNVADLEQKLTETPNAQVLIDGKLTDDLTNDLIRVVVNRGCVMKDAAFPIFIYNAREKFAFIKRIPFVAWYDCQKN